VDAHRTGPFQHSYHESVLQTLADKGNVFHHILGSGEVWDSLRHAKNFRNRHRSYALSANELHSCDKPHIASRTKLIARALQETSDFARTTVIDGYVDSILSQLLETYAVEEATPEIKRISRNWLTLQGWEPTNSSSIAKESHIHLDLSSSGASYHTRIRTILLEAFRLHLFILQETLDDVSSMFEQVPRNGLAQQRLLKRFVSSRLDERRQRAKAELDIHMGEASARAVDLIHARTNRIVELENLNRDLQIRGGKCETCLNIKTAEAKKESEQLTKLREESKDLKIKLQETTSNHNNAVTRSKTDSDERAALRSQLEEERISHEFYPARIAALKERESDSHDDYEKLKAKHKATKKHAACVVDGHALLTTKMSAVQEGLKNLQAELAVERSFREAAEAEARWLNEECDSLRTWVGSMPRRPDRT